MSMRVRNTLRAALIGAALFISTVVSAGGETSKSYPYQGTVTGDSVRMRTGPSTNHAIASVVAKSDTLTVLESKDGWLKVEMPLSSQCWISKQFTRIEGKSVTVTAKDVNLRIRPNTQNAPIGQVSNETLTAVLENGAVVERDGFVRVEPPKTATLWISAEFVAFEKTIDKSDKSSEAKPALPVKVLTAEEKKAQELAEESAVFKELELELAARLKRDGDKKLGEMKALMDQFAESTEQASIREAAKAWVEKIEKIDATLKTVAKNNEARADAEKKAEVIRAEAEAKRKKILEDARKILEKPTEKTVDAWIAKGFVGEHGKNAKIPASHALFDENGKVIFYIRWDFGDLDGMWQKFVGITGTQKTVAGWDKPVIVIQSAKELPSERG